MKKKETKLWSAVDFPYKGLCNNYQEGGGGGGLKPEGGHYIKLLPR